MTSGRWSILIRVCIVAVAVVFFSPGRVHGQAVLSGTLAGVVQDSSGAVLPGVDLTLTDLDKHVTMKQVTDETGTFRFLAVPVGNRYELKAELPGFRASIITGIQVVQDFTQRFTIELAVGNVTDEVTAVAEVPLLDTQTSVTSETLMANIVNELPLYSRNNTEVPTLMPGVSFSRAESPGAWYEFHVRGDPTVSHGYRVDGATTITGHGRTALSLAQNAIERFEFIPGGFQAEYGEQTGGMVNIITKTGTNEVHGSLDVKARPHLLASTVQSGIPGQVNAKQPGNTAFYEAAVGGPIIRDKLWYHAAVQYWRDNRGNLLQPLVLYSDFTNYHTKLTYQQDAQNRWDFSVEVDPFWQKNTTLVSNYAPESQSFQDVSIYLANLQNTHTFSPKTVLQSQVYLHHLAQKSGGLQSRHGTVDDTNYRPYVTRVTPQGSFISGYPNQRTQWSEYRLRDSEKLSTYIGNHNVKAGIDYAYLWGARWANVYGASYTDRRPVGGALTKSVPLWPDPTWHWGDHDLALYVQDSWKVVPRVVVDYGLRWDYQSEVGYRGAVAPRLGVSIDPTGKGNNRIYGNFGFFYQNLWAFVWGYDRTSLGSQLFTVSNPAGTFPHDPYQQVLIGTDILTNKFINQIDRNNFVNPHNHSWTIGYETRLPWNMKVDANYSENRSYNWLYTLTTTTNNVEQSDRCGTNPLVTHCGWYRGLELTLRKPFSHRFDFTQTYTRSRVKGIGTLSTTPQTYTLPQLQNGFSYQDWDEPNVFHTTLMYEITYGIQVTGVNRWESGRPYSINNAQVGTAVLFVDRQGNPSFRNAQRLTHQASTDLSFQKAFIMKNERKLKLEYQILNLFNRVNVLNVQTAFTAAGVPTQVDFSRQMQAGLGISW